METDIIRQIVGESTFDLEVWQLAPESIVNNWGVEFARSGGGFGDCEDHPK